MVQVEILTGQHRLTAQTARTAVRVREEHFAGGLMAPPIRPGHTCSSAHNSRGSTCQPVSASSGHKLQ
jgi:hypothetical protein